jgi:hypothetical protein
MLIAFLALAPTEFGQQKHTMEVTIFTILQSILIQTFTTMTKDSRNSAYTKMQKVNFGKLLHIDILVV